MFLRLQDSIVGARAWKQTFPMLFYSELCDDA